MSDPQPRKRYSIEISEEDIAKAKQNDSYMCVVAQAIARTISDATQIHVDVQTIRFSTNGDRLVYLTPYAVQGYIVAFDAGDEIQPFSFQLREPVKVRAYKRTALGKKVADKVWKARKRIQDNAKSSGLLLDDPAVKAEINDASKTIYNEIVNEAKAAGEPAAQFTISPGRVAPKRVFKRRERTYGHRLLRINQQEAKGSNMERLAGGTD